MWDRSSPFSHPTVTAVKGVINDVIINTVIQDMTIGVRKHDDINITEELYFRVTVLTLFLIFTHPTHSWAPGLWVMPMVVSSGTPELISVTIVTSIDRSEKHIVFPKLLAQNCHDYSAENTMYNRDREKHGTARLVIILYNISFCSIYLSIYISTFYMLLSV